jgi:YHS domain-containing protein
MTHQSTDPVCGMQVEASKNLIEYQGVNYAFCSQHCRQKFSDEPEKYVSEVTERQR